MYTLSLLNRKDFKITNVEYSNFLAKGATVALFYHPTPEGWEGRGRLTVGEFPKKDICKEQLPQALTVLKGTEQSIY